MNYHPKTGATLRYGHVEDFEAALRDLHAVVAAVIMEPIHGTSRYVLVPLHSSRYIAIRLMQFLLQLD